MTKTIKIGKPGYHVTKQIDKTTKQKILVFQIQYPDIEENLIPKHRVMSPFEQKVDLPCDKRYQYLIFAAEPYETIAFKIPNLTIDKSEEKFSLNWDKEKKILGLTIYFVDKDEILGTKLPPPPKILPPPPKMLEKIKSEIKTENKETEIKEEN